MVKSAWVWHALRDTISGMKKSVPRRVAAKKTKPAKAVTRQAARPKKVVTSSESVAEADVFSARGGLPFVAQLPPELDGSQANHAAREFSWSDFDAAVQSLGLLAKSFRPQFVIGLVHGGVFVGGAVASLLKVPFHSVRVTARSRDKGNVRQFSSEIPDDVKGKRVLLVDDIAGSGDSLEFAARLAKAAGAKATKTMALVRRPVGFEPDFSAVVTQELLIFPWDYQTVSDDSRFDPDTAGA